MKKNALAILCCLLASPVLAAPAEKLTLAQAQAMALKNHPQVLAGDLKVKAAKQDIAIARSGLLPQATANAVRATADDNTRIMPSGSLTNSTVLDRGAYGVSFSQLLTDFGRTNDLVDASKLQVDAAKSRSELTRETVLLNVTRAYYNVLRSQALLEVAKSTQHARATFQEQMSSLKDARLKSNLDLNLARQGVQEAKLLRLRAESGLEDANSAFAEALGLGEVQHFDLAAESSMKPYPEELQPLLDRALHDNPEIKALTASWQAARKEARADEKSEYPTISALGYAGDTPYYGSPASVNRTYAAGGVNLSLPIFTGGKLTAQHKKASYEADTAKQELDTRAHTLARDIRMAWNNTRTAYENIGVSKDILSNTREALDLIQARYDLGKSSIVDLAQAQLNETSAEITTANARYEYLIQRAILAYATGGIIND